MNLKRKAAEAGAVLVKTNSTIGLGAGSTIAHFLDFLEEKIKKGNHIQVTTSSFNTKLLCIKKNIPLIEISTLDRIDLYFDGCDQVDQRLNALKSGGGIHSMEKLLAYMANEFVLLVEESKLVQKFSPSFPVVIDVLPQALPFVLRKLKEILPKAQSEIRISDKKDGAVITENGNILVNLWFHEFPAPEQLHLQLKTIPGIVETSLFIGIAKKAIVASANSVKIIGNLS